MNDMDQPLGKCNLSSLKRQYQLNRQPEQKAPCSNGFTDEF